MASPHSIAIGRVHVTTAGIGGRTGGLEEAVAGPASQVVEAEKDPAPAVLDQARSSVVLFAYITPNREIGFSCSWDSPLVGYCD
jgi:hypothetical protein